MITLETPTSIEEAIKCASEFGRGYGSECSTRCDSIADSWHFGNCTISGPPSSAPDKYSNEQWINKCMEELYAKLGLTPMEPNTYYRFTAEKKEYEDAKSGKFCFSYNHRGCDFNTHEHCVREQGKSVANGPFLTYFSDYPYSFLLTGDLLKEKCSDGAPLLEVNGNLKLFSNRMSIVDLLTKFYEHNKTAFSQFSQEGLSLLLRRSKML